MGKETFDDIRNRIGDSHSFLAEGLLSPGFNQTNQSRGQMFNSHVNQCIQMVEADTPMMYTAFENQVGKYSSGYYELEGEWLVLKKIQKDALNYVLIIQSTDTKEFDIVFRSEVKHLTETFGSEFDNKEIDNITEGDLIEDHILYRNNNYDEDMNFKYGRNVRVAYLPLSGYTNEDGIVVSESTAKKMASPLIEKVRVRVNTNDILLNLYGDGDNYKTFPNVGESVRPDGVLIASRRIAYDEMLNKFQDRQLQSIMEGDSAKYVSRRARVMGIDIWNNNDIEQMREEPYNAQVLHNYAGITNYYSDVINYLRPIMEDHSKPVTRNLQAYFNMISEFRDPISEFEEEGRRFDNLIIEFTIMYYQPLTDGSKLTTRYGGKGVVSKIVPDDEMPTLTSIDGEDIRDDTNVRLRADVVCNPFGVINRSI